MNSEKIGEFIKKIRKENNLTQKDLAQKYGVTYQAVSKWENGINLPDISLIQKMSKDFNISMEELLEGEKKETFKAKNKNHVLVLSLIIISLFGFIVYLINHNGNFNFKTISTTCEEFKVTGSIAYNNKKSSIYISHIDYCGKIIEKRYKRIECILYEKYDDTIKEVGISGIKENITLDDYLKELEIKIDNYYQNCATYTGNNLYLEIHATSQDNQITTFKIPLTLNENCQE